MCFGGGSAPTPPPPPPLPPPPPPPPTKAAPEVRRAREEAEKRARSLAGSKSTIATSPQGLLIPESTGTTFLGGS